MGLILCACWLSTFTSALAADIPRREHPRPDFQRDMWLNLNGTWEFRFDPEDRGVTEQWWQAAAKYDQRITVPFCWESRLSGVNDTSGKKIGWYRRTFAVPGDWLGHHVWLRFGAVDWEAAVWVNGKRVGSHQGGYTPFEFDITDTVKQGEAATVVVRAFDATDPQLPRGKQTPNWYTYTSGIWQTVWLEARTSHYIAQIELTPHKTDRGWKLDVRVGAAGADGRRSLRITSPDPSVETRELTVETRNGSGDFRTSIAIKNGKEWSPDHPYLYDLDLRLVDAGRGTDIVHTYFGLRTISRGRYGSLPHESVLLNGKPVYLRGALDQSFNPEGIYTAPSDVFLRRDMEIAILSGLNTLRIHIKADEPRRLYWADRMGVLILQDMPNTSQMSERARAAWENTMRETIARDRNHPAIIAWVLFNETWGLQEAAGGSQAGRQYRDNAETQEWVRRMWKEVKAMDPSRLVEDNSPNKRDHVATDLNSWHFYIGEYPRARAHIEEVVMQTKPGSPFNYVPGRFQGSEPLINSEYGAVGARGGDRDISWGFRFLTTELRRHEKIQGYIYTELTDIEWEHNGLANYDRTPKEFGYDAFVPGMTVRDLQDADFVGADAPPAIEVAPALEIPLVVFVSHFSERESPPLLRFGFTGTNDLGEKVQTRPETCAVVWEPYRVVTQPPLRIKIPGRRPVVGAVTLELLDESGKRIAANFTTVVPPSAVSSPRIEVLGPRLVALRFAPNDHVKLDWKDPGRIPPDQKGKFYAFGSGTVEYRLEIPDFVRAAGPKSMELLAELASKARDERLDWPARQNAVDYPQTDSRKHRGSVNIHVSGKVVGTVELPDDPADSSGALSNHAGFHHGSYGLLVRRTLDIGGRVKDSSLSLAFEVPAGTAGGGLSIYGERMGRFPIDPTILIHTEKQLGRPVGWNSNEPGTQPVARPVER